MNINLSHLFSVAAICCTTIMLASCQSHEKQADDAFERVKEEKRTANDSGIPGIPYRKIAPEPIVQEAKLPETTVTAPVKTEVVTKSINQDEWSKFRAETEKKILANENKIKAIKATAGVSANLLEELSGKEKEYNDLRRKLDEYNEEMKESLGKFQSKINHEVNEIGIDLNDLTIKHKK